MAYDNTKLQEAVSAWLEKRCKVGYGLEYCGSLLQDFEQFLSETAMLKCSPGMTAFGKEMNRREFGRKRVNGLSHMTGLSLIEPPRAIHERRQAQEHSGQPFDPDPDMDKRIKEKLAAMERDADEHDKEVQRRMAEESKEKIAAAGEQEL